MSDTPGTTIAPGWYDDPAGSGLQRWWSGLGWTEHTHAPVPVAPAASAVVSSPADDFGYGGGYRPMSSSTEYASTLAPASPVGKASGNTFGVWAIALSLFWSYLLYLPASLLAASVRVGVVGPGLGSFGAIAALYVGAYAAYVVLLFVFAWRDGVELRSRGIAAPSPWWLLLGQIGYLIRRRIVLKRDGVRSNAPGNVFAIPFLLLILVVIGSAVFAAANPGLASVPNSGPAIDTLQRQAATQLDAQTGTTWTVRCPPDAPATTVGATFVCTAGDSTGRTALIQAKVVAPGRFSLALSGSAQNS